MDSNNYTGGRKLIIHISGASGSGKTEVFVLTNTSILA